MDQYLEAEQHPGARVSKRSYEKGSLYLVGEREASAAATSAEAAKKDEGSETRRETRN